MQITSASDKKESRREKKIKLKLRMKEILFAVNSYKIINWVFYE